MEPTKMQLEKMKELELEMLSAFINACEKLQLRYYLLGGTLLGAVRHQGFIPWDDDIDVGMLREDYEVFISEGQKFLPKHLFIQNIHTDPEYLMCFSKIRNSGTTFVERSVSNRNINHGVYIDIFPLDYFPENKEHQKRFYRKKKQFDRRVNCEFIGKNPRKLISKIKAFLIKLQYPSVRKACQERENLYKSMRESRYIANYGGAWGQKEIVPREWFAEGTQLVFEGISVVAPKKYKEWLSQVYGDYMQLPPEEKRVSHHYAKIIDLTKSYTEYMGENV